MFFFKFVKLVMEVKDDENEQSIILANQHTNVVEYLFRCASY